jgi:hypothetical protein
MATPIPLPLMEIFRDKKRERKLFQCLKQYSLNISCLKGRGKYLATGGGFSSGNQGFFSLSE